MAGGLCWLTLAPGLCAWDSIACLVSAVTGDPHPDLVCHRDCRGGVRGNGVDAAVQERGHRGHSRGCLPTGGTTPPTPPPSASQDAQLDQYVQAALLQAWPVVCPEISDMPAGRPS